MQTNMLLFTQKTCLWAGFFDTKKESLEQDPHFKKKWKHSKCDLKSNEDPRPNQGLSNALGIPRTLFLRYRL